jgi:hypothetical protein
MRLAEKGVRGKGRQPLSPPQHAEAPEHYSLFRLVIHWSSGAKLEIVRCQDFGDSWGNATRPTSLPCYP